MSLLLALLVQAVAPPVLSPAPPLIDPRTVTLPSRDGSGDALEEIGRNDPAHELIDFLGRRRICAEGAEPEERPLLRCSALADEERAWRARYAGDEDTLRWLDQAPHLFRIEPRLWVTFDGPVTVQANIVEQNGTDERGRRYRLSIDRDADGGRSTRITASYGRWPARSFTLSNNAFPLIDLQSLEVGSSSFPSDPYLNVRLSYSYSRRYCDPFNHRQRPEVNVTFKSNRVHASNTQYLNCDRIEAPVADAAPPR